MKTAILALALLATWFARPIEARAQACSGSYVKNRQVLYPLGGPAGQPNSGLISSGRYCCANGDSISPCQGNQDGGPCPNYIEILTDTFNCNDQLISSAYSGTVGYIHRICACTGNGPNDPGALNRFPDGQFVSSSCNSSATCDSDEKNNRLRGAPSTRDNTR